MNGKRIAVIGGGGAGATVAWRLSQQHRVTLFEAGPRLGGHARTLHVAAEDGSVDIDTGTELITERMSPNLYELLRMLSAQTYVTPLSFGASFGPGEYWENDYLCASPLWRRLQPECHAFHDAMGEMLNEPFEAQARSSIGEFVRHRGFSDEFINKALLPVFSTFSGTRASLLDFSLAFCAVSFNEGMLSFFQPPLYRKIRGGFASYMDKLLAATDVEVRTGTPVARLQRGGGAVHLACGNGEEARFDEVVMATHADIALSLLEDADAEERALLGGYGYNRAECIVHSEQAVLCPDFPRPPGFEYRYTGGEVDSGEQLPGSITRHVAVTNHLDPARVKLFVTLNPEHPIDPGKVIARLDYKHATLRPADMAGRRKLAALQGRRGTWYCGMDTTITGHEGAVASALAVADAMGAPYPFRHRPWSLRQFQIVQGVMGLAEPHAPAPTPPPPQRKSSVAAEADA